MLNIQNTNTTTVNYTDFDPAKLSFTKLEENDRSNGQLIGYPRFLHNSKETSLELQFPWTKITTYGVPTLNEKTKKYYKSDTDRAHIRLPLDLEKPEIKDFCDRIKAIDSMMSDPECAKKLLGKNYKKYKYQPTFREIQIETNENNNSDSDEEEISSGKKNEKEQVKANKPPYIKLKLDLTWPDNNVKTKVFSSELDLESNNKRIRTKIEISSIDDFANVIRYLSTIRCIAKPFKAWAHPITKKDPEYGIGWKVIRVELDKVEGSSIYKSLYESDRFIDSDSEDELPKVIPQLLSSEDINNENKSDDEEEENKLEDKSEDEEEIITKTTQKIVEVDSSDEEEVKPPPPKNSKKNAPKAKK